MKYLSFQMIICILCLLLMSCENSGFPDFLFFEDKTSVCIKLPSWPPVDGGIGAAYPKLSFWIVEVHTPSFTGQYECSSAESLTFEVLKNEPLCVTATPVCFNSDGKKVLFFKCAGTVYPFSVHNQFENHNQNAVYGKNNHFELTWKNGFTAYLVQSLFRNGKKLSYTAFELRDYISRFNWDKLINYIEEKQSDENHFYNPWLCDLKEVLNGIAFGSFKANLLNMKNVFTIDAGENNEILSSYVPENKNIQKKSEILIKKSEVNVFSDYNLNGIIIKGDSVQGLAIEYISLPLYIEEYEKTFATSISACLNDSDFLFER